MAKRKTKKSESPRDRSVEDLKASARDLEKEIFALRNERAIQRKTEKPHLLKAKRHERARVLTLLTVRERSERT